MPCHNCMLGLDYLWHGAVLLEESSEKDHVILEAVRSKQRS